MKSSKSVLNVKQSLQSAGREKPSPGASIITLTSDFGLKDYFVASLKGVLLQKAPGAQIVDVTHQIDRHDIVSGAFILKESFNYFPRGTVHLVVIDPGVGTNRKVLLLNYRDHYFVGPDNGVFTYLLKDKKCRVYEVVDDGLLLSKKSPTFAGRDHFAPLAAALANGKLPSELGREMKGAKILGDLFYRNTGGRLRGRIVYFDTYGNAITNLMTPSLQAKRDHLKVTIQDKAEISGLKSSYSEGNKGEGNLIINSSGHLEIFSPYDSAEQLLKLKLLDKVLL